jgi:hypothetical protein
MGCAALAPALPVAQARRANPVLGTTSGPGRRRGRKTIGEVRPRFNGGRQSKPGALQGPRQPAKS